MPTPTSLPHGALLQLSVTLVYLPSASSPVRLDLPDATLIRDVMLLARILGVEGAGAKKRYRGLLYT